VTGAAPPVANLLDLMGRMALVTAGSMGTSGLSTPSGVNWTCFAAPCSHNPAWKMKVISSFYAVYAKRRLMGGPVDSFVLTHRVAA